LIALYIFALVYILIAIRKIGPFRVEMWQAMLLGGCAAIAFGAISLAAALESIDWGVIVFLFSMFVVARALETSGYLEELVNKAFSAAKSADGLLASVIIFSALSSAILINDTIAVVGVPVAFYISQRFGVKPLPLLMALAFSVTIGSVPSPIGNPQNLLVAVRGGFEAPFFSFLSWLLIPTLLNLAICFIVLKMLYRKELSGFRKHPGDGFSMVRDKKLASISRIALIAVLVTVLLRAAATAFGMPFPLPLPLVASGGAAIVLIFSERRAEMVRTVDWGTLLFFAGMFVLMQSVWDSGAIQSLLGSAHVDFQDVGTTLALSVVLSQVLSNVPFVTLYLPLLAGAGEKALIALAAGSTLAGNLTLLGAASNIIIAQNAEKRGVRITFWEFARSGVALTIITVLAVYAYLSLF